MLPYSDTASYHANIYINPQKKKLFFVNPGSRAIYPGPTFLCTSSPPIKHVTASIQEGRNRSTDWSRRVVLTGLAEIKREKKNSGAYCRVYK